MTGKRPMSLNEAAGLVGPGADEQQWGDQPTEAEHYDNSPRRPQRQVWLWWLAVAVALFVAASLTVFAGEGTTALVAASLVVAAVVCIVAARQISRLWPYLSNASRVLPALLVAFLAVCFGWGLATQPTLDGTPLLVGSEQATEVFTIETLAKAHQATVADARLSELSDEQVRTRLPDVEAAAELRERNARQWAALVPPVRVRAAVEAQARFDDATGVLLRARIAAATQPSEGRTQDVRNAAERWREARTQAETSLVQAADAVGLPESGRPWGTSIDVEGSQP